MGVATRQPTLCPAHGCFAPLSALEAVVSHSWKLPFRRYVVADKQVAVNKYVAKLSSTEREGLGR
jgi:hypothetical protein